MKTRNAYNISKDIEDGIHDICMSMQKYDVDPQINNLVNEVTKTPLCLDEYNDKINRGINKIFKYMPSILLPKIYQLRDKLVKKYINKNEFKLTKTFWNNNQINKPIIEW